MHGDLLDRPPYSIAQPEKQRLLLAALNDLTAHHADNCPPYARILDVLWGGRRATDSIDNVPFLPTSIFKTIDLVSTADRTTVMTSSGTTGQGASRIFVDATTSARQSRALVETLKPVLGPSRLPFLIIDSRGVISDPDLLTARGAGVLGLMKFGAKATFVLDNALEIDVDRVCAFVRANGAGPFLIFGFTYLLWSRLFASFSDGDLDLSNAILIHSGGWKRMESENVPNSVFRECLRRRFGIRRIYNFYGMIEQIGSIFLEGDDGNLYPPNFADVIIRDERSWDPLGPGEVGLVQVLSTLPLSYPGHSLLTEDRGEIVSIDSGAGGRLGKAIRIHGRLPRAELRGCSDVVAAPA